MNVKRQLTALKEQVFDSSLEWEIEHFMEYPECDIFEIESDVMKIEHFDSAWQLTVFPKTEKTSNVAIGFKVLSLDSSHFKTLLKFEVRAEITGNEMMSPANRHLSRTRGPYAEPVHEKPAVWTVEYTPVQAGQEFLCENFIDHQHLPYFLGGGCLTLRVNAFIKTVEVVHNFEHK